MKPSETNVKKNLSKAQQAALVVLALEEGLASEVLRGLGTDELRQIAAAVKEIDPLPIEALAPALAAFESSLASPLPPAGGEEYLRRLTEQALGADHASMVFTARPTKGAIDTIRSANDATLAELLEEEHPQLAAVVLTQLPREQAARVLLAMSEDKQLALLQRIADIEEIPGDALRAASEALASLLSEARSLSGTGTENFDGIEFAAGLMNELPKDENERLLEDLEDRVPALAPRIREAMFTFEDLCKIDSRSMQSLMREVPTDQLLVALKTASPTLRENFFSAVSQRAAQSMREDLEIMPPKRVSEVEEAQRAIVDLAMRLAADGQLELGGSEDLV